ncbi:hypothetical protein DCC85_01080 [Paenibacillus sp. CAA11]|uniref:hypothetical protein n=1 Tax=Paenibacillus sp. CAA11 TaxID=1532905 RepID=UPI000D369D82|nr:hypothetical protein [Paenibacillus sp. CAA11]AWB42957.1 hypothetical protein DCC85_01080 [Paenibacillus sp. CAA11]
MSLQQQGQQEQTTLYQMDPATMHNLKSIQDHMASICKIHVNKLVRVETVDGDVFEGLLIHSERGILYLRLPSQMASRGFVPGFQSGYVLPLVLFNLLTISLL